MSELQPARSRSWKWWVCGLLLCASTINYMDRQTLANASVRITAQFHLSEEQYGALEKQFGWAFAVGSLAFGFVVDRVSVRWVYPVVLLLWSLTGFATGLVSSYTGLLVCRTCLGLFEGGHWPCGVKTTQRLLEPKDRAMGNGVLQSGTSIGAIVTPLVMAAMLTPAPDSWRRPFQMIGIVGFIWLLAWFVLVRARDLPAKLASGEDDGGRESLWRVVCSRRMVVIMVIVALINTSWQTLRAWLPKFLQQGRGYSESAALHFNALFYVATDVGVIGAGALTLWLVRRGVTVHGSRRVAFGLCAALGTLTAFIPFLSQGWLLLGVFLLVGAGVLGTFPIYHALTQDLSRHHQGKVTGIASLAAWAFAPPAQQFFGRLVDRTGSYDAGFVVAGWLPMLALIVLWLGWEKETQEKGIL